MSATSGMGIPWLATLANPRDSHAVHRCHRGVASVSLPGSLLPVDKLPGRRTRRAPLVAGIGDSSAGRFTRMG